MRIDRTVVFLLLAILLVIFLLCLGTTLSWRSINQFNSVEYGVTATSVFLTNSFISTASEETKTAIATSTELSSTSVR